MAAAVIDGRPRDLELDVAPVLWRHVGQLRRRIQLLARPGTLPRQSILHTRPPDSTLPSPGIREPANVCSGFSRPVAFGGGALDLARGESSKRPSPHEDAFYSAPNSPSRFPPTSTPRSEGERPPLHSPRERLLPLEYLRPPTFPTLQTAEKSDEDSAPSVSRRPETDLAVFVAEYERNKRRLEERRRTERTALARASPDARGGSAERFRSSLDDLSLIIDEMADLMHIGVAEASASEVQERAEALWGKETAAQLSEEWSREPSSRGAERSGPGTSERPEGVSTKRGRGAPEKRPPAIDPGRSNSAKEWRLHRSRWPVTGPGEISHPLERRGNGGQTLPTEASLRKFVERAEEEGVHRTKWPVTGPEEISHPLERQTEASAPSRTEGSSRKRPTKEDGVRRTKRPVTSPREVGGASSWKAESKKWDSSRVPFRTAPSEESSEGSEGEAASSQRIWKFEESSTEDFLDRAKQRRAEICRTTVGSLPVEQKVATVKLVGPKKKKRKQKKMCNLKIVCIVSPAGNSSASDRSEATSKASDSKSERRSTFRSESRFEDAASYF